MFQVRLSDQCLSDLCFNRSSVRLSSVRDVGEEPRCQGGADPTAASPASSAQSGQSHTTSPQTHQPLASQRIPPPTGAGALLYMSGGAVACMIKAAVPLVSTGAGALLYMSGGAVACMIKAAVPLVSSGAGGAVVHVIKAAVPLVSSGAGALLSERGRCCRLWEDSGKGSFFLRTINIDVKSAVWFWFSRDRRSVVTASAAPASTSCSGLHLSHTCLTLSDPVTHLSDPVTPVTYLSAPV
ncbi:hypothetical protein WMY93_033303 [Mugilogobius chulae]|uniref:Uncharacterized protein n=1 Tax=Mugilogobius chulae TaxID=88201 RepID=A0AAW0MT71_9GOBI